MDPTDSPNLYEQAKAQYPVLEQHPVEYKEDFGRGQGYLESWPPGETGSAELPRPADFAKDSFGVEVYDRTTRPIDILGDIVSHKMINDDPVVKDTYQGFVQSIEPWQEGLLQDQYQHAQQSFNEDRPYDQWKETSGLPAYFRGHPFQQWDNSEKYYTKEQLNKLDGMMDYLRKGKK